MPLLHHGHESFGDRAVRSSDGLNDEAPVVKRRDNRLAFSSSAVARFQGCYSVQYTSDSVMRIAVAMDSSGPIWGSSSDPLTACSGLSHALRSHRPHRKGDAISDAARKPC